MWVLVLCVFLPDAWPELLKTDIPAIQPSAALSRIKIFRYAKPLANIEHGNSYVDKMML